MVLRSSFGFASVKKDKAVGNNKADTAVLGRYEKESRSASGRKKTAGVEKV